MGRSTAAETSVVESKGFWPLKPCFRMDTMLESVAGDLLDWLVIIFIPGGYIPLVHFYGHSAETD